MGNEVFIVLGVLAIVWIGILILRVPAFVAFFSLLTGQVISSEVSLNIVSSEFTKIGLLLLPFALTIFLLRGRTPKSRLFTEFLPAFSTAIVLVLLLYPMVDSLRIGLDMASNDQIGQYRSWLLIACSGLVLTMGLLHYPKSHDGKHH